MIPALAVRRTSTASAIDAISASCCPDSPLPTLVSPFSPASCSLLHRVMLLCSTSMVGKAMLRVGKQPCCSTAQHSTAQHSTAQHGTAQHSMARVHMRYNSKGSKGSNYTTSLRHGKRRPDGSLLVLCIKKLQLTCRWARCSSAAA